MKRYGRRAYREVRTSRILGGMRFTPDEACLVEDWSRRSGMNLSDLTRRCILIAGPALVAAIEGVTPRIRASKGKRG